ncbi:thioesterase [Prauserella sp. ASG 168]|uniref:Thioesterase n=1 Tax=Prauserella cavernicola TaxID=2800127 RepID=A0A934QWI2_9PSEU|nr:thioesterase [Prauserella cavernicola]
MWIRRYHSAPESATKLVVLPHAGGSASFYHPMSRALSSEIEVLTIQYPGRQERRGERCLDNIGELADRISEELIPWSGGRLAMFGHSMGAVLAFEITRRLKEPPVHLFVSGRRAPSRHRDERVHLLDDQGIIAEMKSMGGTAAAVLADEEVLRMALPAVRGDYRAVETYRCEPDVKVSSPITVLTGDSDPKVTPDEAAAWRGHTTGDVELKVFRGGHFYLVDHAQAICELVAAELGARP